MEINRRKAASLLGGAGLAGMLAPGRAVMAGAPSKPRLHFSGSYAEDREYRLSAIAMDGRKAFEFPLPRRAHGIAVHPARNEAVVIARGPGTFAIAFDLHDGSEHARLRSLPGRHFRGHGVFSRSGARLFTTETDLGTGRGVIGVWDSGDGYRRMGEFALHGIGPHEIILSPDGHTLIVAIGGYNKRGRRKINIPTMVPSLAYIDSRDGRRLEVHSFETGRNRLLSIRHLDVNADGVVCIGLQDEGLIVDWMPLVAFHRRGQDGLDLHAAPGQVGRRMRGYTGSAIMDSSGRFVAVSAPHGSLVTFWDVGRRAFLTHLDLVEGCGIAAAGPPGEFLATSGAHGGALRFNVLDRQAVPLMTPFVRRRRWDNHLVSASLERGR